MLIAGGPISSAPIGATFGAATAPATSASLSVFAHHYRQMEASMPLYLKQSTASQEILLGPFVDDTDGKTAETGLTIANTDIKLWKAGATSEADKNSGGATHIAGGRYYAVLDATDTDTIGSMVVSVHVSGALPVRAECVVLAANVYDSMIAGTDALQVDTTQISGDATAADNLEAAADGTGYALGGSLLTTAVADAVWDETLSDHLNSNSTGLALNSSSSAGDPWNTSLPGVYASGTAGHIIGNAQVTAAQIRTALGLASANLDTQLADLPTVAEFNARTVASATYASATDLTSVKTVTDKLDTAVELDGSVYRFTTNALEQAPGGSAPTASQVADAVWDELYAGHTLTGSFGLLVGSKLPLISASSVNVASVVDAAGNIKHLFQGADHTTIPIDIPIDGTTLDLSGSGFTLALRLERNVTSSGDAEKCITGYSVISGGTASQKVRFTPTAADTATLAVNASGFDRNPTVYSYWAYKYQVIRIGNASGSDPEVIARGYASVINLIACS